MWLPLVVGGLLCVTDVPPEFDAFLDSARERELSEGLRPEALALLARSHVTAFEPRRGVPTMLWAERFPFARAPREQGLTASEAARQHLLRYASVYRLHPRLVASLVVSEVHDLGRGAVVVGFARAHEGLPVLRDELDVVMTEQYELVAFTGSLALEPLPAGAFRLDAVQAIATAAQRLSGSLLAPGLSEPVEDGPAAAPKSVPLPGGWTRFDVGPLFDSAPRARRVYFDDAEQLLPAWHLEVEWRGQLHAVVVSAVDGRVLSLVRLEAEAAHTYRVWADGAAPFRPLDSPVGDVALPHPTGVPDTFAPAPLAGVLVTLDHAGLSTGDPWLPAGASSLSGNNVHAYADLAPPDGLDGGLAIAPSSSATFDFSYALDQPAGFAPSQRAASATHAFFVSNWMHDALYDLGFDEQARNAQRDNLGRGGVPGDAVLVEVHDFSGRNNANMRTPADGESPRMQLFLFDEPRASTLRLDGGDVIPAPIAVSRNRSWNTSGPVRVVTDPDGGLAGCEPWADRASLAGSVVVVDVGQGCNVRRRFDHALDAGVAALVLTSGDTCFALTENTLVAVCVSADAGALLRGLALDGGVTAQLERPAGNGERDVALDTTVVAHEYGHLVTNRLIGDSLGLFNTPARGMGEGWSDFLSLWFGARASDVSRAGNDQWQGAFAIGGWSSGGPDWNGSPWPSHYFGVRRYPYSTDRAKNPLTFKHVGSNVPLPPLTVAPRNFTAPDNAQVHNTGELWASILWDAQVKLFQRPNATVDAARLTMGRYLVAGLRATPPLPTFIEARDALLSVIAAESPAGDFPLVLDAFAKRGLGVLAQSSDRRSITNTPLAEDFTGAGGNYRLVSVTLDDTDEDCDADGQLDRNETGTLTVQLMNIGSRRLTRSTLRALSDLPALTIPLAAQAVPPSDPFTVVSLTLPVSLGTLTGVQHPELTLVVQDPDVPVLQGRLEFAAPLRLNLDLVPSSRETFETGAEGWDLHGEGSFPWEQIFFVRRVSPTSHVLTGRGMDSSGTSTATTPPLAIGAAPFTVTFTQTYVFEATTGMQFFDGGRLELSTDGETFTPVPSSRLTPGYNATLASSSNPLAGEQAWSGAQTSAQTVVANFGTDYANRTVWLRWRVGADDATGTSGWNVDDVVVSGATMQPFTEAVAHRGMCRNNLPTISGTTSLFVAEGATVKLVPGSIVDRDADPITVTWMQSSGPSVQLDGDAFIAPEVAKDGAVLGFRVTIDDGRGGTDTDDMTVSVRNVNRAPTVMAGASLTVVSGEVATLEASGLDDDGDALSFRWVQRGEATVTLENAMSPTATFVAPEVEVAQLISFEVRSFDAETSSAVATVDVTVTPKPRSCGCMTVESLLGIGGLLLLRRRRKRG